MSFTKYWTEQGQKEILRDEQLDDAAEWERTAHEAGECCEDCPHCEADREAAHYQRSTFDRLHNAFVQTFKKGVGR